MMSVRATWRIASEAPVGEAYHISTDTVVTIRELVEMLCGMLGILFEEAVQSSPERPGKDEAYWLESDMIRQLGWTEQISLEEGAINVIEWVRRELPSLVQQPYDYVHKPLTLIDQELNSIASDLRFRLIRTSSLSDTPHVGSCLSCMDLLVYLYWRVLRVDPKDPLCEQRDRFI
jgi:hypothetical protein